MTSGEERTDCNPGMGRPVPKSCWHNQTIDRNSRSLNNLSPLLKHMTKRMFLIAAVLALTGLVANNVPRGFVTSAQANQVDILIVHGKLVDGSGRKARKADVGIRGDRIVFVGDAGKAKL